MSSLALLMQQHHQEEQDCSTCEKDSGITTSCHANRFESTQKITPCHHQHHHLHKAPPRQYSSSSTDDEDEEDDCSQELEQDETEPPTCSSTYSDHYLMAMHPCSPKSAPTWNWTHNRRRGTGAASNKRATTKTFGGSITKNHHIAASIEALNRQYHQQIYLGGRTGTTTPTNCCLEDEGDEKTSPELNNATIRPPEATEAPEETMFELEM